jgi:hypothetical protein
VGLVWLCGERGFWGFYGIRYVCSLELEWEALFWRGVLCNSKEEGIVWKCICIYVLSQWKMVEEPSCALCKFILLKNEEGSIV